jgi:hypothetical protein
MEADAPQGPYPRLEVEMHVDEYGLEIVWRRSIFTILIDL